MTSQSTLILSQTEAKWRFIVSIAVCIEPIFPAFRRLILSLSFIKYCLCQDFKTMGSKSIFVQMTRVNMTSKQKKDAKCSPFCIFFREIYHFNHLILMQLHYYASGQNTSNLEPFSEIPWVPQKSESMLRQQLQNKQNLNNFLWTV